MSVPAERASRLSSAIFFIFVVLLDDCFLTVDDVDACGQVVGRACGVEADATEGVGAGGGVVGGDVFNAVGHRFHALEQYVDGEVVSVGPYDVDFGIDHIAVDETLGGVVKINCSLTPIV